MQEPKKHCWTKYGEEKLIMCRLSIIKKVVLCVLMGVFLLTASGMSCGASFKGKVIESTQSQVLFVSEQEYQEAEGPFISNAMVRVFWRDELDLKIRVPEDGEISPHMLHTVTTQPFHFECEKEGYKTARGTINLNYRDKVFVLIEMKPVKDENDE